MFVSCSRLCPKPFWYPSLYPSHRPLASATAWRASTKRSNASPSRTRQKRKRPSLWVPLTERQRLGCFQNALLNVLSFLKNALFLTAVIKIQGLCKDSHTTTGRGLSPWSNVVIVTSFVCVCTTATGCPRWAPCTPTRPPTAQQQHPQHRHTDSLRGRPEW